MTKNTTQFPQTEEKSSESSAVPQSIIPARPAGQPGILPMTRQEMLECGWNELDVLLVSGDAYVDHPSFGVALLGRLLASHGFRVGIVAQPQWENKEAAVAALTCMGRPRLFTGVTAGAIDSMLAHYTAFRKKRHDDAYTPGGACGARPNRATIVYTGLVRQAFPGMPVVLGGIEASLRRVAHYDFWSDSLRRPLLADSKADLLLYGMGERGLLQVAYAAESLLKQQENNGKAPHAADPPAALRGQIAQACRLLPGTVSLVSETVQDACRSLGNAEYEILPSYEDLLVTPQLLMQATLQLEQNVHAGQAFLLQEVGGRTLMSSPPAPLLDEGELDFLYSLPFSRLPHPGYALPVPAWEMIRTSITTHRGCGGGCSFCSLALHQGRRIASRSKNSLLAEAKHIAQGQGRDGKTPRWAGSISDVGGPSANMWQARCAKQGTPCKRASCLHPAICPFFKVDQQKGAALLRDIAAIPGIRHVRIASGVRFDLALQDDEALLAYTAEFTGGQLKVAPEHCAKAVLQLMRKPSLDVFEEFLSRFAKHTKQAEKELYAIPYLMSAFPGCTIEHMRQLQNWLARKNWRPQQVQCFIPTPGTVATAMFYTGLSPDGEPLYVARTDKERLEQHHLLFPPSASPKSQSRRQEKRSTPAPLPAQQPRAAKKRNSRG